MQCECHEIFFRVGAQDAIDRGLFVSGPAVIARFTQHHDKGAALFFGIADPSLYQHFGERDIICCRTFFFEGKYIIGFLVKIQERSANIQYANWQVRYNE